VNLLGYHFNIFFKKSSNISKRNPSKKHYSNIFKKKIHPDYYHCFNISKNQHPILVKLAMPIYSFGIKKNSLNRKIAR